jgi:sterol desaturase/sphingolipid hydroxylase (fatty acid hydroxylase superfamily)
VRTLLSWSVFPTLLVAEIGAALILLAEGVSPIAVAGGAFVVTIGAVALLERLLPYRETWNRSHGDLATDALYLPLTAVVTGGVEPAARALAAFCAAALAGAVGIGFWPTTWPLFAQLALACVVAEFFDYFAHRVLHEHAWLWRLHATHHSPARLYWLNATRSHPVEMLFRGAVGILPLALLGAGHEVFILLGVVNIVVGFFQHANIDFALGPLSWVFSVGELHRWHHSRQRTEADCNYGNNFIFWDAVFGTRYLPPDRRQPDGLGIAGLDAFPQRLWDQLLSPWRWHRIEAASRR